MRDAHTNLGCAEEVKELKLKPGDKMQCADCSCYYLYDLSSWGAANVTRNGVKYE